MPNQGLPEVLSLIFPPEPLRFQIDDIDIRIKALDREIEALERIKNIYTPRYRFFSTEKHHESPRWLRRKNSR